METYKELKNQFSNIAADLGESSNDNPIEKKLDDLLQTVKKCIEELNRTRTVLFFPKASSEFKEINELGFLEEQTAIAFLASPQTHDAIIQKLKNSFDLGKIDYASYIFQKLLPQIPKSKSELQTLPKDKFEFFRNLESMNKQFLNVQGITYIDQELKLITGLEKRITELKQVIN